MPPQLATAHASLTEYKIHRSLVVYGPCMGVRYTLYLCDLRAKNSNSHMNHKNEAIIRTTLGKSVFICYLDHKHVALSVMFALKSCPILVTLANSSCRHSFSLPCVIGTNCFCTATDTKFGLSGRGNSSRSE